MTGAMYAAIGGLKSHMSKLNVIGNNIANVNTYGYKAARMTFRESMYTTSRAGSNGGVTNGGNNPSQIGYGCSVGSIDLNMAPSTYAPTGYGLDCMIDGEGFFLVGTKDMEITSAADLTKPMLSRVGDLWVDPNGYVCDRGGNVIFGFATVQNPYYGATGDLLAEAQRLGIDPNDETMVSTELVPLRLPLAAVAPTVENGGIVGGMNQWEEGDAVYGYLTPVDDTANNSEAQTNLPATDGIVMEDGVAKMNDDIDEITSPKVPNTEMTTDGSTVGKCVQLESMSINENGAIIGINSETEETVVVGYIAIASVDSPDGVTHLDGPYYKAMGGAGDVRVSCLGGVLDGRYLNNKKQPAANAPDGTLAPEVNDAIMSGGTTEIRASGLEASSTDIATEFSEMITTQRGYQANTRIITVTDSMLEELVNMKR